MSDANKEEIKVKINTEKLWKYFTSPQIWEAFARSLNENDKMLEVIHAAKKYAQELEQTVGWLREENKKLREVLNIEPQGEGE